MTTSKEDGWIQTIEWHDYKNGDKPTENKDYLVYFTLNDNANPAITIASFKSNQSFPDDEWQPKEYYGGGTFSRQVTVWSHIPASPIEKKE